MGMLNMDTTAVGEESERVLEQLDPWEYSHVHNVSTKPQLRDLTKIWDLLRLQLWMNPLNKALTELTFFLGCN